MPYRGPLRGWASGQVFQAVTLSVLGLVPGLRGSQGVSQPRWWKRKHGPHCTEAGLRLGSVAACVLTGNYKARFAALVACLCQLW